MKKYLKITLTLFITTIIVLGFAMPLNPAGNWYQQFLPNLNGRIINDITFTDSLNGYAITNKLSLGDTSYVLKTTNGGDNWVFNRADSGHTFNRIQFINQNTGFIGGYIRVSSSYYIFKTTNKGINWSYVNSPFQILAHDMFVLNEDTIWIVDSESLTGGVFRTTNGGANWTQQLNIGSQNPTNIYFYNKDTGFTAENTLYRTTNGGSNWILIPGGTGFSDMYFINSSTGWKTSFQKTTNGGLNWINQPIPQGGNILISQIVEFTNIGIDTIIGVGSTIITGSGNRGMVCRSTNGGNNWTYQVPDSTVNIFQYQNIAFTSRLQGWVYTGVTGMHTTSGGDPIWLTDIEQISSEVPTNFKLYQNYPNPFNPNTKIKYSIRKQKSNVKLIVYDMLGKEISKLADLRQDAGTYEVEFSGNSYSSGTYFYSLIIDSKLVETRKMILIK